MGFYVLFELLSPAYHCNSLVNSNLGTHQLNFKFEIKFFLRDSNSYRVWSFQTAHLSFTNHENDHLSRLWISL